MTDLNELGNIEIPDISSLLPASELRGRLDLDVYTVRDLETRLDLRREQIHKAILAGALDATRFGGQKGYVVTHAAVVEWLARPNPYSKEGLAPADRRGKAAR